MLRCPNLPLLPGNTFPDVTKTRFHQSHHFELHNGVPVLAQASRSRSHESPIVEFTGPVLTHYPVYPPNKGPQMPSWLAYDKQVLGFYAHFRGNLEDVYRVPYQNRNVKILYYLEDDTIQVSEPRIPNSGIPQGCLVSRQRIRRSAPYHNDFLTLLDINVNQTTRIFDQNYFVTGCDNFTRKYLNRLGIPVPELPADEDEVKSATNTGGGAAATSLCAPPRQQPFAQFLANDQKVLSFQAYWDNRDAMFGDLRHMQLNYYLADDTIDIKEVLGANSGRDGGMFLRRLRLPKNYDGMPRMGEQTAATVLNVLGHGLRGGRFILDRLCMGNPKTAYYNDTDLRIGQTINVFGRKLVLTDCDNFTRTYYRTKYGIEDNAIGDNSHPDDQQVTMSGHRELPPFNGWGSHEDSEGNCLTVEPKPPRADFKKFIQLDGCALRFGAQMKSSIPENEHRAFIITYYLSDDTIAVYEFSTSNSGFSGGDFFRRAPVLLPNQNLLTSKRPKRFMSQHFYLGASIVLNSYTFRILTADEYSLAFMEAHPSQYHRADVDLIVAKIREALRPNYKDFMAKYMVGHTENGSPMDCDTMRQLLTELLGNQIVEHEIITVCRHFAVGYSKTVVCKRERVRAIVHQEIKRNIWDAVQRLKEHLYHLEPEHDGHISPRKLISALLACRVPLQPELVDAMIKVLEKNEQDDVKICDFLEFIDTSKPCAPVPPVNTKRDVCSFVPSTTKGRLVDWNRFVSTLGLEAELCQTD